MQPRKARPANPLPEFPEMSAQELLELSQAAGRTLTTPEEAHQFRRKKLHEQEAQHFVYGRNIQPDKGASLLELVVVTGIVLTVMGIGIPGLLATVDAVKGFAVLLNGVVIH